MLQNVFTFSSRLLLTSKAKRFMLDFKLLKATFYRIQIPCMGSWCFFIPTKKHPSMPTFKNRKKNYDFPFAQSFHHLVLTSIVEGGGACSIVTDTREFTLGCRGGASDNGQGG